MITVGQIRDAIEGLPDDAPVFLHEHYIDDLSDEIEIELVGITRVLTVFPARLRLKIEIRELDCFIDDDDDDYGFDDDDDDYDGWDAVAETARQQAKEAERAMKLEQDMRAVAGQMAEAKESQRQTGGQS
jgi:hypothetical protein